MAAKQVTIKFSKEKETKNKQRYTEDGDNPVIGKLYVSKETAAELGDPETLSVTLKA